MNVQKQAFKNITASHTLTSEVLQHESLAHVPGQLVVVHQNFVHVIRHQRGHDFPVSVVHIRSESN